MVSIHSRARVIGKLAYHQVFGTTLHLRQVTYLWTLWYSSEEGAKPIFINNYPNSSSYSTDALKHWELAKDKSTQAIIEWILVNIPLQLLRTMAIFYTGPLLSSLSIRKAENNIGTNPYSPAEEKLDNHGDEPIHDRIINVWSERLGEGNHVPESIDEPLKCVWCNQNRLSCLHNEYAINWTFA